MEKQEGFEKLLNISEEKNYTYYDYMCNQPKSDGKEIRDFFSDDDDE